MIQDAAKPGRTLGLRGGLALGCAGWLILMVLWFGGMMLAANVCNPFIGGGLTNDSNQTVVMHETLFWAGGINASVPPGAPMGVFTYDAPFHVATVELRDSAGHRIGCLPLRDAPREATIPHFVDVLVSQARPC